MLLGFAVDYIVLLAAGYEHSGARFRKGKTDEAYREYGISILSSTITTIISAAFMYPGAMESFGKFAYMLTSIAAVSFFVTMLLFGALCHSIGPQDGFGDLRPPMTAKMWERHLKMKAELDDY